MNLFRKIFGSTNKTSIPESNQNEPLVDWESRIRELEYTFGTNAEKWIYNSEFGEGFIREFERIYLKENLVSETDYLSNFDERSWINFPGPFYTVETDNCGTGQLEAPDNILYDEEVREHVFRQPRTIRELSNVFSASYLDPFQNYCIDGNDNWTLELIKEWWSRKTDLIQFLNKQEIEKENEGQNRKYIDYLNTEAEMDLRFYASFLEDGKHSRSKTILPDLK